MNQKNITIPNVNKKLACDVFVHITLASKTPLPYKQLPNYIFHVKDENNSMEFDAQIIEAYQSIDYSKMWDYMTLLSHGMTADEWRQMIRKKNPDVNEQTQFSAYFYKKIA